MHDLHTPNVEAAASFERDRVGQPEPTGITADDVDFDMPVAEEHRVNARNLMAEVKANLARTLTGGAA